MSVCTFIASDSPLREAMPQKEYPPAINIDEGTVYDGGADENFYLRDFKIVLAQAPTAIPSERRPDRQKSGLFHVKQSAFFTGQIQATGATGSTLPVEWISVISFRGHLVTQAPQEVHLV